MNEKSRRMTTSAVSCLVGGKRLSSSSSTPGCHNLPNPRGSATPSTALVGHLRETSESYKTPKPPSTSSLVKSPLGMEAPKLGGVGGEDEVTPLPPGRDDKSHRGTTSSTTPASSFQSSGDDHDDILHALKDLRTRVRQIRKGIAEVKHAVHCQRKELLNTGRWVAQAVAVRQWELEAALRQSFTAPLNEQFRRNNMLAMKNVALENQVVRARSDLCQMNMMNVATLRVRTKEKEQEREREREWERERRKVQVERQAHEEERMRASSKIQMINRQNNALLRILGCIIDAPMDALTAQMRGGVARERTNNNNNDDDDDDDNNTNNRSHHGRMLSHQPSLATLQSRIMNHRTRQARRIMTVRGRALFIPSSFRKKTSHFPSSLLYAHPSSNDPINDT